MLAERASGTVGCLVIDGFASGEDSLSGLSSFLNARGVRAAAFCPNGGRLHAELQRAYQRVRGAGDVAAIAAAGTACDAALALAGQLPADRLVLIGGARAGGTLPDDWRGQLRRIRAFARRNAVFCVADVLAVEPLSDAGLDRLDRLGRALCNSRFRGAAVREDLWINRKEVLKMGVYRFLCDGVLPKSLAENPEMCIIYG